VILVLAGGVGLGAYQAGVFDCLDSNPQRRPRWIAGSSVGAVNAALIAGAPPERAVETLRKFWNGDDLWIPSIPVAMPVPMPARHAQNWLSALQSRLLGAPGHFTPRTWSGPFTSFQSLYDLAPMQRRLARLIDFERLNSGEIRVSIATTDIESGEPVVFDTQAGARISMEHLLASCGYLPEFAPVEIDGRLLGDGGFYANAPVDLLQGGGPGGRASGPIIVADLFARDGERPASLEGALARRNDLFFGNQTLRPLRMLCHYEKLGPVLYLSYRASDEEAGPEKPFDLSRRSIARRWEAGMRDMQRGLELLAANPPLGRVTVVRAPADT
jgi:NTE family protein